MLLRSSADTTGGAPHSVGAVSQAQDQRSTVTMIQYRLTYNGIVLATGYTYTEARQVQTALAWQFAGTVAIEAYRE